MPTPKKQRRETLIKNVIGGLLTAFLAVIGAVSYARLIFSGDLEPYLAPGLGLGLFSCAITSIIMTLGTRYIFNIGGPRSPPAAIIAVVGSSIAPTFILKGEHQHILPTLVGFIAVSTLTTGLIFVISGKLKLGKLIRYIPYPVIGGFIAGIGAVIIKRTFYSLTKIHLSLETVPSFFYAENVVHWAPPLVWGGLMFVLSQRIKHFAVLPGMIFSAYAGFFLFQFAVGYDLATLREGGWLLGSFPSGLLWPPISPGDFSLIHWNIIGDNWGNLAAIVVVSTFTLLMHSTAYEILCNKNMDLNHELYIAGLSNIASGVGGGMLCFPSLTTNALAFELKSVTRQASFTFSIICILFFFVAGPVLSYLPNFILGSLLFYQGFSFFVTRIQEGWQKLPKPDYAILLLITGTIVGINFIAGVIVGLIMFTIIFVLRYSTVSIIKNELPGSLHHSNVVREEKESQTLNTKGDQIYLFQLTGYLFFGTANQLYERVLTHISTPSQEKLKFPIFDFSHVTGLDASAVFSFSKLLNQARKKGVTIIYTNLSKMIHKQLSLGDALCKDSKNCRVFHDPDHALEFCENEILKTEGVLKRHSCNLPKNLLKRFKTKEENEIFHKHMEEGALKKGQYLFRQGEAENGLYFIREGLISVEVTQDHETIRLQEMGPGSIVGEIALYTKMPRIADVKASEPVKYYHLTSENFRQLQTNHPLIANAVHCFVVELLSQRLKQANSQIQFLMK